MKKKTHDEYVKELKNKNPNIEVIGIYINAKTKIMHRCLIHKNEWEISPNNALKGKGCVECAKEKQKNKLLKTHETYVEQVRKNNPNVIAVEQYVDNKTPILHLCKKHNIKWKILPSNVLRGQGCNKCAKEKIHKYNIKKYETYINELSIKNPSIEVIEDYLGSNVPILHHCLTHDKYWKITPHNALRGDGCKICRKEKIRKIMSKSQIKYTNELFIKNPTVELVDDYINSNTSVLHHCLIHDEYWNCKPYNALKGCGCYKCLTEKISKSNSFTNEEYILILQEKNKDIISLEKYVNIKTPILHKCLIHNYEWITTPSSILQGCGCPKCKIEKISTKIRKTHNEYVSELKIVNPDIIVIENYIDSYTPILHKCLIHNCEWYNSPFNVLSGTGCPQCKESRGERTIRQWLESNNISYVYQKVFDNCKDIRNLPFDFYLPDYNLCIEYDGKQHFEPVEYFGGNDSFKVLQRHDKIKNEYCKQNNILILRIPYYENIKEKLDNFYLFNIVI